MPEQSPMPLKAGLTPTSANPTPRPPTSATTPPKVESVKRPLLPPSSILMGPPGAGKTTALTTYMEKGIETFVIGTEPGFQDSLIDAVKEKGLDMNLLHWTTCMATTEGWEAIDKMTQDIGSKDFEAISKIKGTGKSQTREAAMRLLSQLKNFECERTGKAYGEFTKLTNRQALALDSLSGLSVIGWYLTVGYKPTGAPGEWNIAQNWIMALVRKINSDRNCYFTMTAHVEKEPDELTGVNKIMVSTLGKKLAPQIPKEFGEIIYAQRHKEKGFHWSTIDNNIDLKNRALPISDNLKPTFAPIVERYEARLKEMGFTPQAPLKA